MTRILVVDDDADILYSVSGVLRRRFDDVEVLEASGPDVAEDLARRRRLDLLLTDYRMPIRDGLALTRAIRQLQPNVGVVLFTAYPDVELAQSAVNEYRIDAFLSKPASVDDMFRTVAQVLHERKERAVKDAIVAEVQEIARHRAE